MVLYRLSNPDLIKKKKATINRKYEDDKCFQYVVIVALNYRETESHTERISNIKLFINKYKWRGKTYPSKDDWTRFEKTNLAIALNILYIKVKESPAFISKIDSNCEKQIILLMIPNGEKEGWYYLAVKIIFALLHGITPKYRCDSYCLNCLHSFRTGNKLKSHEEVCRNKTFGRILMKKIIEKDNILEFNHYMKSDKMPYIIYVDIESIIKEIDGYANNPENSSTLKIA